MRRKESDYILFTPKLYTNYYTKDNQRAHTYNFWLVALNTNDQKNQTKHVIKNLIQKRYTFVKTTKRRYTPF